MSLFPRGLRPGIVFRNDKQPRYVVKDIDANEFNEYLESDPQPGYRLVTVLKRHFSDGWFKVIWELKDES